jgi:hypothetical protein
LRVSDPLSGEPAGDRAATSDWDLSYGETRRIEANTVLEPISPELVLVDPELRREVRERLLGDLLLEALPEPGPAPSQAEPAPSTVETVEPGPPRPPAPMPLSEALHRPAQVAPKRRKRRLAPALLPVSLAVNVILIALSVSDARIARTSPSAPLAIDPPAPNQLSPATKPPSTKKAHRPAATTSRGKAPRAKSDAPRLSAAAREARGKVEQKVLNTVIQSPTGKLPRALIDSTTGLAKNGLQAYCRRETRSPSFLCVVRPARHKPGEGLYARYRLNREGAAGAFTWYPYRSK